MAVEAKTWPNWEAAKARLEATPPQGWRLNPKRWWGERPLVWRYLDEVVGSGSFDEQRARFAEACAQAKAWLSSAHASTTEDVG